MFYNCLNKAETSQIFPVDFIFFLFPDYCWEIVNILIYLTKYSEMPSMMEQIFYVKTYYETKSFQSVQAKYKRKLHFVTFPNQNQIFKLVKNFEAHSTFEDYRATSTSPPGLPITIWIPKNVTRIQGSVHPDFSDGGAKNLDALYFLFSALWLRISNIILIGSRSSTNWPRLTEKRVAMSQWFSQNIDDDEEFLNVVWFSDEAYFLLNSRVNSTN